MLIYTFEVAISWTLFYCIYYFLLRKETFFQYNRLYLLGTLFLGLVIPFLPQLSLFSSTAEGAGQAISFLDPITVTARNFSTQMEEIVITGDATSSFNIWKIILGIWAAGTVVSFARFGFGLLKIYSLFQEGKPIQEGPYVMLETEEKHLPFSFFNILFWSNHFIADPIEKRKILDHELVHIRKGHSYDNILVNLLLIPFWWVPPIYAYQNALNTIHEYEADSAVTAETPVCEYSNLLLQYANIGFQLSLTHSFAFTQLKNRIIMMTQKKSNPIQSLKYLALLPVAFILMSFFSGNSADSSGVEEHSFLEMNEGIDPIIGSRDTNKIEINTIPAADLGDVFKVVDQMPIFEKCPDLVGDEAKSCGQRKMLEYVYSNIKYPALARENGIQGIVVIRFIVDKTGKVVNPEIVRDIGAGTGEEVLRVVNSFPTWVPGIHEGQPVNVYYNLPVKFKLEDDAPAEIAEQPRMSGCEDFAELDEKISCSQTKMLTHVYTNIKYPALARENGIEGVSVLRFDVGIDGKVKNPAFKKFIGGDCEEAILDMFEVLQEETTWIPAKTTDGKIVEAEVILPIKFKLQDDSDTKEKKIEPLALSQYKLFPNPASNEFNLTFTPSTEEELKLEVYDTSGKLMLTEQLGMVTDRQNLTMDSKNWSAGTYLIRIVGAKQMFLDQLQIVK